MQKYPILNSEIIKRIYDYQLACLVQIQNTCYLLTNRQAEKLCKSNYVHDKKLLKTQQKLYILEFINGSAYFLVQNILLLFYLIAAALAVDETLQKKTQNSCKKVIQAWY